MSNLHKPTLNLIGNWLQENGIEHETCEHCDGLHLPLMQDVDSVIDCRLFLEDYGLLLSTSLEVRPMALLPIAADLGRLNMAYATLKIFLDVVDDATPRLVGAGILLSAAGISRAQFDHFLSLSMDATRELTTECMQLDYLFPSDESDTAEAPHSIH